MRRLSRLSRIRDWMERHPMPGIYAAAVSLIALIAILVLTPLDTGGCS